MADYAGTLENTVGTHPSTYAPLANAAFPPGTPVCLNPDASGDMVKARANSSTTKTVTGLARTQGIAGERFINQYGDILKLTVEQWNEIKGGSGGLTPGPYFLSAATAGLLTATAPVSEGQFVAPVGIAISTTEMLILISYPTEA